MNNKNETNHDPAIRSAMDRLLAGNPLHTDGRLTIKNLAKEAGLSRQQIYRSPLAEEFKEHIERLKEQGDEPQEKNLALIAKLRQELAEANERATKYRQERDEARANEKMLAQKIVLLDQGEGKKN
jgi:uncharacterized coiled-coil DUF342 family protein